MVDGGGGVFFVVGVVGGVGVGVGVGGRVVGSISFWGPKSKKRKTYCIDMDAHMGKEKPIFTPQKDMDPLQQCTECGVGTTSYIQLFFLSIVGSTFVISDSE